MLIYLVTISSSYTVLRFYQNLVLCKMYHFFCKLVDECIDLTMKLVFFLCVCVGIDIFEIVSN